MAPTPPNDNLIAGIDIGGTKVGACVGHPNGVVLAAETSPTDRDPAAALDRARDTAVRLADGKPIARVGIAVPGPFDRRTRRFLDPPNMPTWHGFDVGTWADRSFSCPTRCMNDANAAALSEWLWGSAAGVDTLIFLTVSTGLGAGIVVDGRPIEGAMGLAGEVGRVRLAAHGPVGFGAYGTAEGFASGPGIEQAAAAEVLRCCQAGEGTAMADASPLDARAVCAHAQAGDAAALRVTTAAAGRLGQLIAILANVLEPDAVVLGTIAAAYPDLFVPEATRAAHADTVRATAAKMRIEASTLDERWARQALAAAARARD